MKDPHISVVIPALNEEEGIEQVLDRTRDPAVLDRIVVDGGSDDRTSELARSAGARVTFCDRGRAAQMNFGAQLARGRILLFLHADTLLPIRFGEQVTGMLKRPGVVVGAFRLTIDSPRFSLRIIERGANTRSRWLGLPYGDQALFLARELFEKVGGFRELPIMEDFELVRRLHRFGRVGITKSSVLTSARRWETMGPWKTTLIHQAAILAYSLGVPPGRIARLYNSAAQTRRQS